MAQAHNAQGVPMRIGGGKDRHVIQMIANASLDAIEEVMRKENAMYVFTFHYRAGFLLMALVPGI